MLKVLRTDYFTQWLRDLNDRQARFKIVARIRRAEGGNLGDWKSVGEGVSEMRVDYGPGYRVYFARRGTAVILLLAGGNKATQFADINAAKRMLKQMIIAL